MSLYPPFAPVPPGILGVFFGAVTRDHIHVEKAASLDIVLWKHMNVRRPLPVVLLAINLDCVTHVLGLLMSPLFILGSWYLNPLTAPLLFVLDL